MQRWKRGGEIKKDRPEDYPDQGLTFLAKEQAVNILGFAVSVTTTQLGQYGTKAATDNA